VQRAPVSTVLVQYSGSTARSTSLIHTRLAPVLLASSTASTYY
jgi:hypothetical protein